MQHVSHLTTVELELLKPLAEARAAQIATENYEARRALADELGALAKEEADTLPPLEAAAAASFEAFEQARKAYESALADAERDAADAQLARRSLDARRDRIHHRLNQSAPAAIEALETDLRSGLRRTGDALYSRVQSTDQLELVDGLHRPRKVVSSNLAEIEARQGVIRAALQECEGLRLQAVEPAELTRRLAALREKALGHLKFVD